MKAYFKYEDDNDAKGTFSSDFRRLYGNTTGKKVLTIINILTMITLLVLPAAMRHILAQESYTAYMVGQIPGSVLSTSMVILGGIMRDASKYYRINSKIEKGNMFIMIIVLLVNGAGSAGIVYPLDDTRGAQMVVIITVVWLVLIPYIHRRNNQNKQR